MNTYFISDPHFGHNNIRRFERTQFASIEEHDSFIIDQVNSIVKPQDILYILGDLGELEKVRLLNGRKILIMGNHDSKTKTQYLGYFAEVYDTPIYFSKTILLSHIPQPVTQNILNVHGHLHGSYINKPNYVNLSIDVIKYRPISADQLYLLASRLPKESIRFLDEWYADLYKFPRWQDRIDIITDENGCILLEESRKLRDAAKERKGTEGYALDVFRKEE
jgi:calcineurin-like phosphoesterase family protein